VSAGVTSYPGFGKLGSDTTLQPLPGLLEIKMVASPLSAGSAAAIFIWIADLREPTHTQDAVTE
jgi:hypothetical protein